jgi:hypothetical protein
MSRPFQSKLRRGPRKLLLVLAALALLAGATAAVVMAAQPASHRRGASSRHHRVGLLATAAAYLGVAPAQLREELRSGKSLADVADATPGKSAAGLIQALEKAGREKLAAESADLQSRIANAVERTGLHHHAGRRLTVAAGYLGLSTAQLRSDLRAGDTLAQIAGSTAGKSQAGLIEALAAAHKAKLAGEVHTGTITQAHANAVASRLTQRITASVNRARHARR